MYLPYLFLANDGTGINTGMLVKSTRVNDGEGRAIWADHDVHELGGNQAMLNDRTPLVLHVGIKRAGGSRIIR